MRSRDICNDEWRLETKLSRNNLWRCEVEQRAKAAEGSDKGLIIRNCNILALGIDFTELEPQANSKKVDESGFILHRSDSIATSYVNPDNGGFQAIENAYYDPRSNHLVVTDEEEILERMAELDSMPLDLRVSLHATADPETDEIITTSYDYAALDPEEPSRELSVEGLEEHLSTRAAIILATSLEYSSGPYES